jgi:hypothetical protein
MQGGNLEQDSNANAYYMQEQTGEDVASAEAWSEQGQDAGSWGSLFTPVVNPFSWWVRVTLCCVWRAVGFPALTLPDAGGLATC